MPDPTAGRARQGVVKIAAETMSGRHKKFYTIIPHMGYPTHSDLAWDGAPRSAKSVGALWRLVARPADVGRLKSLFASIELALEGTETPGSAMSALTKRPGQQMSDA